MMEEENGKDVGFSFLSLLVTVCDKWFGEMKMTFNQVVFPRSIFSCSSSLKY